MKHKQIVPKKRHRELDLIIEVDQASRRFWRKNKIIMNKGERHSVHKVDFVRSDEPRVTPYNGDQTDLGT